MCMSVCGCGGNMHSGSNSYIDKCGMAAMLCYACMGGV